MAETLALIGAMYRHEKQIRDDTLTGAAKREYRTVHIRPVVEAFWKWCRACCERTDLLPKSFRIGARCVDAQGTVDVVARLVHRV